MKFSRLFLISLLAVLTLVLVQLPASTSGSTGNPIVATSLTGNPVVSTTPIVVASPNKPSALASYTITFNVDANLNNGVDEIIIVWDEDFKDFPSVIANSAVSIRATAVTGAMGTPGQARRWSPSWGR